jgi:hypothetical protein
MLVDPDAESANADSDYRGFDWVEIGRVVREAVESVGAEWRPGVLEVTARVGGSLNSAEWEVVHDWLSIRPVVTSPSFFGEAPPVRDGQHRLWCAGVAGAYPLPVLMEDLQDAALVVGPGGSDWSFDPVTVLDELQDLAGWYANQDSGFRSLNPTFPASVAAAKLALAPLAHATTKPGS